MGVVKRTHKKARLRQQKEREQRRQWGIKRDPTPTFDAFIRAICNAQSSFAQVCKTISAIGTFGRSV